MLYVWDQCFMYGWALLLPLCHELAVYACTDPALLDVSTWDQADALTVHLLGSLGWTDIQAMIRQITERH
jgi:hypothetical protein